MSENKSIITFLIISVVLMLSSCGDKVAVTNTHGSNSEERKTHLLSQIDSLESVHAVSGSKDPFTVKKLMSAYLEFRNYYKKDERTADYFYKASELALSIGDWDKSAEILQNYFNTYKNRPNRDDALFQMAFIYDFEIKDKEKAKQSYEHYIKLYEDSNQVENARARLAYLDLNEEELIKMFQEKNNK